MPSEASRRTPFRILVIAGLLSLLLFLIIGPSYYFSGCSGVALAAISGFGIGFTSAVAGRTRPSRLWAADLTGSLLGLALTIIYVREISLHGRHPANPWVLIALPVAATMGGIVASHALVRERIDRALESIHSQ